MGNVMKACIIMHNMILEDKKEVVLPFDLNEALGRSNALPPTMVTISSLCFFNNMECVWVKFETKFGILLIRRVNSFEIMSCIL
jgi:hypothetical protein